MNFNVLSFKKLALRPPSYVLLLTALIILFPGVCSAEERTTQLHGNDRMGQHQKALPAIDEKVMQDVEKVIMEMQQKMMRENQKIMQPKIQQAMQEKMKKSVQPKMQAGNQREKQHDRGQRQH